MIGNKYLSEVIYRVIIASKQRTTPKRRVNTQNQRIGSIRNQSFLALHLETLATEKQVKEINQIMTAITMAWIIDILYDSIWV